MSMLKYCIPGVARLAPALDGAPKPLDQDSATELSLDSTQSSSNTCQSFNPDDEGNSPPNEDHSSSTRGEEGALGEPLNTSQINYVLPSYCDDFVSRNRSLMVIMWGELQIL